MRRRDLLKMVGAATASAAVTPKLGAVTRRRNIPNVVECLDGLFESYKQRGRGTPVVNV